MQSRYDSLDSCSALDNPEHSLLADMSNLCHTGCATPRGMCYAPAMPETPRLRTVPMFPCSTLPKSRELPPFQVSSQIGTAYTQRSLNGLYGLTPGQ